MKKYNDTFLDMYVYDKYDTYMTNRPDENAVLAEIVMTYKQIDLLTLKKPLFPFY